ncbi:MAG: tRNA pseudouridine(55) synthase TruB [Oscillospiraceae bacterium]
MKNGIIPVNKPQGFTSFDVIAKMRGILKTKKLGHAGTLDPMATGVLPVFVGTATKACDILPDNDKAYKAEFVLGQKTDTGDITGKVTEEKDCSAFTGKDILSALTKFTGEIMQVPPMYSAVSVGGKRLYELARKGIEIEREPRKIEVFSLRLISFDEDEKRGVLYIECSKGTYIRTLIEDIAESFGAVATMTALCRVKASGFDISECVTIEELSAMDDFSEVITPIERVFSYLPKVTLNEAQTRMYKNGIRLSLSRIKNLPQGECLAVFGGKEFLGTALADREKGELIIAKNFYDR